MSRDTMKSMRPVEAFEALVNKQAAESYASAIGRHGFVECDPTPHLPGRSSFGPEATSITSWGAAPFDMSRDPFANKRAGDATKQANPVLKGLPFVGGLALGGGAVAAADAMQDNRQAAQANIVRAKADYNRARLRNQQAFQKMSPTAQREILKYYNTYANTVADATATGAYPIVGGSLF